MTSIREREGRIHSLKAACKVTGLSMCQVGIKLGLPGNAKNHASQVNRWEKGGKNSCGMRDLHSPAPSAAAIARCAVSRRATQTRA